MIDATFPLGLMVKVVRWSTRQRAAEWRSLKRALQALALVLLLRAVPALGQSDAVQLPRALSALTAPYPAGATGDGATILELTVDSAGMVSDVRVVGEHDAFADAAASAARAWKFEPATRRGTPIAAKIRVRVEFLQETSPAPITSDNRSVGATLERPHETEASASPNGRLPEEPIEIIIEGRAPDRPTSTLGRAEVRELPGAFGDPFRAIEVMPGVTPIISGLPFFYLRGSPPGNVGYFVDGIRVPYLYHFGLGPSVLHPGLTSRVDLHAGGYPASFGHYAGGIVAAVTTTPRPKTRGELNVRLFDAGALVETGFNEGRGTILLAGRYSYTAALISVFAPTLRFDYHDFQTRVTYQLGGKDRVSLLGMGSYDLIGERRPNGDVVTQFGVEFYRADLLHEHRFGGGGSLATGVTLGFDQSHLAESLNARDHSLALRSTFERPLGQSATLRAGFAGSVDRYSVAEIAYVDPEDPTPPPRLADLFPSRTDFVVGAHAEVQLRFGRSRVTPGLRVDNYVSENNGAVAIEPRLALEFPLTAAFKIVHALGIAHQPPSFAVPVPGFQPELDSRGLQRSLQNSGGVELALPLEMVLSTRLFHHVFLGITDALGAGTELEDEAPRADGFAAGLELSLKRPLTKHLGGLVSYTLSRSSRSSEGGRSPSAYDRAHVLNAALGYDLGKNWRLGGRFVFYTGVPKDEEEDEREEDESASQHAPVEREPSFFRIDARVEKRWMLGKSRFVSLAFEWLNASMQKETVNGKPLGPITIPSLVFEGAF